MEWLRCNKCYRAMKQSKRTFSLTQCGHLYCSQCMAEVTTQCPECGSQNFATLALSYPPKLETTHNYFAYLDEFMEICLKTAEFQYNQLSIAVRGFEEIEKKYVNMKKSYWNGMEQMKSLTQAYAKLQEETTKLENIRESLLKTREARNFPAVKGGSNFSGQGQAQQNQRIRGYVSTSNESGKTRASGLPCHYEDQRSTAKFPATDIYAQKPKLRTAQQTYNSNTSFSTGSLHSDAYASESGVSSKPRSSTSRTGVFLVPSTQKVPKSAASLKRKTPTSVRLTDPKIGFNF